MQTAGAHKRRGQWSWKESTRTGQRCCFEGVWLPVPRLTLPFSQTGQYTSVFLDNASGSLVTVQGGSQFSALLLGI